jgi:AAA domain
MRNRLTKPGVINLPELSGNVKEPQDGPLAGSNGEQEPEEQRKTRLREKYKGLKSKPLSEASRDLPPVLIEGIQYLTRRMLIAGASKSRKSFLCLQMAFCISKGLPIFDRFKTLKVKLTFANLELLEATVKLRLEEIAKALDYKGDVNENIQLLSAADHQDQIGEDFAEFLAVQAADDNSSLVCIDPMWRLLGNREENSNTDIGQVLKPFARFSREARASAIGVHHFAKGSIALKDAIDRASGAGAWARDAATLLIFSRHREVDAYIVDIISNDFAPIDSFVVRFMYPIFVVAADLDPTDIKPAPAPQKEAKKSDQQADKVIAVLHATDQEGGLTQAAIRKSTRIPRSSLNRVLTDLMNKRKVYKSNAGSELKFALTAPFREALDEEENP